MERISKSRKSNKKCDSLRYLVTAVEIAVFVTY